MPKFPIINIFREKSDSIIIIDFLFITSLTLKLIISRINVRENRIGKKESTIQRHRQHWEQDTVRRESTIQRHRQHWEQDTVRRETTIQRHRQHWEQDTVIRETKINTQNTRQKLKR